MVLGSPMTLSTRPARRSRPFGSVNPLTSRSGLPIFLGSPHIYLWSDSGRQEAAGHPVGHACSFAAFPAGRFWVRTRRTVLSQVLRWPPPAREAPPYNGAKAPGTAAIAGR